MPERMGPSQRYLQNCEAQQQIVDEMDEDDRKLVHEYGFKKAMEAFQRTSCTQSMTTELAKLHPPIIKRKK